MSQDRRIDNQGSLGITVFECTVGDTIEVCHSKLVMAHEGEDRVRGFKMSEPDMGNLVENSDKSNCVDYTHTKAGKQVLEFKERYLSKLSYIEIAGSIRVHDHSSIPQGGPAYATYYSEIEEEEAEGT